MSFISDIFDALTGVFGSVFGIAKKIGGSISDAVSIASITSTVQTIASVVGSIDSTINTLGGYIQSFISPITTVVGSIANLGKDIEDHVIGPILNPINSTITEIKTLSTSISKLVDQGISGILQIPKAVSDALVGISTSWTQATRQLADANQTIASETLVPGINAAVAPGLKGMADAFLKFASPQNLDVDQITKVALAPSLNHDAFTELATFIQEHGKNPSEWYDWIFTLGYYLVLYATQLPATLEPVVEEARAEARKANPVTTFDVGTTLELLRKGIIDTGSASAEMLAAGFDNTRQQALVESTFFLPDAERAGDWFRRGLISEDQYNKLIAAQGGNDADVSAFKAAMEVLLSPQILLDMLARGIIPQETFDTQMRAQGYTDNQIKQVLLAGVAPAQVASLIAARGNLFAADNNWFASTYGAAVPDDMANIARATRIDTTQVAAQWTSHWGRMPISMAVNLFFRGLMNRQEVGYVVGQNDYPVDMTDLFIENQSTLVTPRSVPSLLAHGTINEAQAKTILQQRGYSDADANLLIADALGVAAGKKKPTATALSKLTVSELGAAFKDGIIDEATYTGLLVDHGLVGQDVTITVALDKYNLAKEAKKDLIATLKAEVSIGTKTIAQATDDMFQANFTQAEVDRVVASLHQTKKAAAKIPSYAQMASMAKHSLIDQDMLLAGVQALGYGAPWDQLLVTLVFTPGASSDGTLNTPTTS